MACFLISISPVSPPQGELNGQRGLVPSNFLEGPGPEAGSSHREPGTPPTKSQVSEELCGGGARAVWWDCAQAGAAEFCQRSPARASSLHRCPFSRGVIPSPAAHTPGLTQMRSPVGKNLCASTPLAWCQKSPTCWISLSPQSLSKPVAQPGRFLGSHSESVPLPGVAGVQLSSSLTGQGEGGGLNQKTPGDQRQCKAGPAPVTGRPGDWANLWVCP